MENSVEPVVILRWDGIIFVIVAAGAGDGQAKRGAADGIDAVFPFVGHDVEAIAAVVFGAEAEEAEGC